VLQKVDREDLMLMQANDLEVLLMVVIVVVRVVS